MRRVVVTAMLAAGALWSCGGGAGAQDVSLTGLDNVFQPMRLELPPGAEVTVTFTNDGSAAHTFTSEQLGFDTGSVGPGETREVTFTAPEERTEFVCTFHEASDDMVGEIVPE